VNRKEWRHSLLFSRYQSRAIFFITAFKILYFNAHISHAKGSGYVILLQPWLLRMREWFTSQVHTIAQWRAERCYLDNQFFLIVRVLLWFLPIKQWRKLWYKFCIHGLYWEQGRNDGGQGGHNDSVAESLGIAEMSQQCRKVLSTIQYIYSQKTLVRTLGRLTCFSPQAPSNLVMDPTGKHARLLMLRILSYH